MVFANIARHKRFFAIFTLLALALRWVFIRRFEMIAGDALIYGEIALNLLQHGIYGLAKASGPASTLIRLPGYPLFLTAVFAVFGAENYRAAMYVQMFVDVGTCFVIADLARRVAGERVSRLAFVIAACCPLTINYVSTALTETLTLFFTALAFDAFVAALQRQNSQARPPMSIWIGCGLATSACILLRPDGGFVLISIGLVLIWRLVRCELRRETFIAGVLVAVFAFAPLIPWGIRNWRVFHVIQPLAPYAATDPGEPVQHGFSRWVLTWLADYSSLEDMVFNVPGETADFNTLPNRAFDSPEERAFTQHLFEQYADNDNSMPAELDAEFGKLADARIARHPLRTRLWRPIVRTLDMWLRPRTEFLPIDIHWWHFKGNQPDSLVAISLGLLNLLIVCSAIAGIFSKPRMRYISPLVLYIVLRTTFLGVVGAIEPRYTIECFPLLYVFAAHYMDSISVGAPSP